MFEDYRFPDLPSASRRAARNALSATTTSLDLFDLKIAAGLVSSSLSTRSRKFFRTVRANPKLGKGFPLASRVVREAVSIAMIETILRYGQDHPFLRSGYRRLRMVTICPDVGIADICGPDFPMKRTKDTMRRAMQGQALQGLGMLDIALFSPARGFAEHLVAAHSHHAVFYDNPILPLKKKEWSTILAPASGNLNKLGAPIVYISPQDRKLTRKRAAGLGWYISKETCGTNTMYQASDGQKSESSFTDWSFAGALRQLEMWSHLDARDTCWSTGDLGAKMRLHWRRRLMSLLDYNELPRQSRIDSDAVHEGWARLWCEMNNGFLPVDPAALHATRAPQKLPTSMDDRPW